LRSFLISTKIIKEIKAEEEKQNEKYFFDNELNETLRILS